MLDGQKVGLVVILLALLAVAKLVAYKRSKEQKEGFAHSLAHTTKHLFNFGVKVFAVALLLMALFTVVNLILG